MFAAMGVNMETAHFFKQVRRSCMLTESVLYENLACLSNPNLSPMLTTEPRVLVGLAAG